MTVHELVGKIPGGRSAWVRARRLRARYRFKREFEEFRRLSSDENGRMAIDPADCMPCLDDRTAATGFDRHYVLHTAWAARILRRVAPQRHIDISSSLYFVSIVSAFVDVEFRDYRPANLDLPGLSAGHADLNRLNFEDRSVRSLSCMHVVEHIGLGRYGDTLDPVGDLRAMRELQRVVAVGGSLLFVVPVGRPRVCFNAHRVYAFRQVIEAFAELKLEQFALIPDREEDGGLLIDAGEAQADAQNYGCGCFWFRRIA